MQSVWWHWSWLTLWMIFSWHLTGNWTSQTSCFIVVCYIIESVLNFLFESRVLTEGRILLGKANGVRVWRGMRERTEEKNGKKRGVPHEYSPWMLPHVFKLLQKSVSRHSFLLGFMWGSAEQKLKEARPVLGQESQTLPFRILQNQGSSLWRRY